MQRAQLPPATDPVALGRGRSQWIRTPGEHRPIRSWSQ